MGCTPILLLKYSVKAGFIICLLILVLSVAWNVAAQPSPDLLEKIRSGEIEQPYYMKHIQNMYRQRDFNGEESLYAGKTSI